jgi:hypothetical protein
MHTQNFKNHFKQVNNKKTFRVVYVVNQTINATEGQNKGIKQA